MNTNELPIILATDPSINSFGYACCVLPRSGPELNIYDPELWLSGVIYPQGIDQQHKWQDVYERIAAHLRKEDHTWPTHMVVEWPMFFRSPKGCRFGTFTEQHLLSHSQRSPQFTG
jgi:hypothetical protein